VVFSLHPPPQGEKLSGGGRGFGTDLARGSIMSFRSVFIALVIGFGLVLAGFLINRRPRSDTSESSAALVRASGKCAECHTEQHYSIVHEYELSAHAAKGIDCLECHQPAQKQDGMDHHGFVITKTVTAANCRSQKALNSSTPCPNSTALRLP
jgi:hypothetical protein